MDLHTLRLRDSRKRLDRRLPFPFANEFRGEQYTELGVGEEDFLLEKPYYIECWDVN